MKANDSKIEDFILKNKIKVNKNGTIFRFKNGRYSKIKPFINAYGYQCVGKNLLVHRIVFRVIKGFIDSKKIINHKDGNKLNNHISNLENITVQDNSRHARDNQLNKFKITAKDAEYIRKNPDKLTNQELSKKFNLHINSIYRILKNRIWTNTKKTTIKKENIESPDFLISKLVKDNRYVIKQNGVVFTFLCKKGKKNTEVLRRVALIKEAAGYISIRYNNRLLKLHRVIYWKFVGPIGKNKFINHKDGNKSNNNVKNLEQVSRSQNALHASRVLRKGVVKISFGIAKKIRKDFDKNVNFSIKKVAKKYNLHPYYVWSILYNKKWYDPSYCYKPRKKAS